MDNKDLLQVYEEQDLAGENVQRANAGGLCACITCLACCDGLAQGNFDCSECCNGCAC